MKTKGKTMGISIVVVICFFLTTLAIFVPIDNIASATTQEEKMYCTATLEDDFADNKIVVVITNRVSISNKRYTIQDFSDINCIAIEDLFAESENNSKFDPTTYHRILSLTIGNPGKQNILDAICILEQRNDVLCVDPDYAMDLFSDMIIQSNPSIVAREQGSWWRDVIDLDLAKNLESGSSDIKVGIIDSGIDGDHSALVENLDSNLSGSFTGISNDNPLIDTIGHGTFVAGLIGATMVNTTYGMEGVCDDVTMISLKVTGEGFSDLALAIAEATRLQLPLINVSLGDQCDDQDERNVLLYACMNYQGLMICAAGNEGENNDNTHIYPACFELPQILSVGNSSAQDRRHVGYDNSSNYGATCVDIFAPGALVYSTTNNGGYTTGTGTSYAAPIVTGVAALMLSRCPDMPRERLRFKLLSTAEEVFENEESVFKDLCVSNGRLNAHDAVQSAHEFDGYTPRNIDTHQRSCAVCGEVEVVAHTWLTNSSGGWKCWICGMTTLIKPVINPGYLSIGGEIYVVDGEWCCKLSDLVLIDGQYYMRAENTLATQEIDHLLT